MAEAKATVIPNFLTASTPKALRRLMFLTNKRLGAWHNYQISFVQGKWVAWYHEDLARSKDQADIAPDPREKVTDE